MKKFAAAITVLSLSMTGACATDVQEEPEFDDEDLGEYAGMDPETTFFTRTSVRFLANGEALVTQDEVSLAQQIRERDAEDLGLTLEDLYAHEHVSHTAALSRGSCSSSSNLRMYSDPNYVGEQLCLSGQGSAALHSWTECTGSPPFQNCLWTWGTGGSFDMIIESLKVGQYNAMFDGDSDFYCSENDLQRYDTPYTNVANAPTLVENATWVRVGSDCHPD